MPGRRGRRPGADEGEEALDRVLPQHLARGGRARIRRAEKCSMLIEGDRSYSQSGKLQRQLPAGCSISEVGASGWVGGWVVCTDLHVGGYLHCESAALHSSTSGANLVSSAK
jgi:hypothetical protein